MVEGPPEVREVAGSMPGKVIPNTLTIVVMANPLGRSGLCGLALRLTGWCQDKWTNSTGNYPGNPVIQLEH